MASWSTIVKRVVSLGLVAGSLGAYANDRLSLRASYGVVAGPAITVRAPGDGVLKHSLTNFAVAAAGSQVGMVTPTLTNDPDLRAAAAELATIRAEVDSLKSLIGLGEEMRSKTLSRQTVLAAQRSQHLERMFEQAQSAVEVKRAAMEAAELAQQRATKLCAEGLLGARECEDAQSKTHVLNRELESARAQVGLAKFIVDANRAGADIGQDLGSEVTYARQQRDELTLRLGTLKQQLETQQARAKALELRVSPPAMPITVAAKSRVWSVFHQNSASVVKSEPLFQVVDCTQLFVFATATEDRYEKLRIGMAARVEIDGRKFSGKIVQLLGPYGTFSQDRGMQPQPPVIVSGADATSASVAIAVPELASAFERDCQVGIRAEVEFID